MHPALEQLKKIVSLELSNGFANQAVIGGLPKLLVFWEPNARRGGLPGEFIDSVIAQVQAYPEKGPEQRPAAIQALLEMVRATADAMPTSTMTRPGAPSGAAPAVGTARTAGSGPAGAAGGAGRTNYSSGSAGNAPARPAQFGGPRPAQPATPAVRPPGVRPSGSMPAGEGAGPATRPPAAQAPSQGAAPATRPPAAQGDATPTTRPPEAQGDAAPVAGGTGGAAEAPKSRAPEWPTERPASGANMGGAPAVRPPAGGGQAGGRGGRPARPAKQPAQQQQRPRRPESSEPDEQPVDPRPRRASGPKPVRSEEPVNKEAGLDAPLTVLHGVGPETAKDYERLGITSLRELLLHFPRRYDDYSRLKTINRLEFGEEVSVIATVWEAHVRPFRGGQSKMLKVILSDPTGSLEVTFFNQEFLAKQFTPGRQIVISGRIDQYLGRLTIVPSEWEDLDRELLSTGRIVPVYRANADLRQKNIRKLTSQMVKYWAPKQPDHLPAEVVAAAGLMPYDEALAQIHFPDNAEKLAAARHRLAFDELLLLQIGSLRQRRDWQANSSAPLAVADDWLQGYVATLPYTLTSAQQRAVADIRADMARLVPMNRLLQGDVGSGKTAVAATAMAAAIQAGAQAAIMAPTSILAEQHYRTLAGLLAPVLPNPGALRLLQGSTTALEKEEVYAGLRSGEIKAVVGTHALIEGPVAFANLGLVIVDEQHRFGVAQRAALRGKGTNPHLLVMTATPIPRSLALTVYGDLDLSVLDEMPPGRQPIATKVLKATERERGYAFIRSQIEKGRQAFIIFPLVEESDKIEAKAAVAEHARLQKELFPDYRLGLLHGRLKADDKEAVMTAFREGEYQVLVSTSVVEVGVDIPNATVILIEGANRFGLAQLHQFRGRVGRGDQASICLLVSDIPAQEGRPDERLLAMEQSQDGFYLAEKDLELRGPGDFLGTRQSGYAPLLMARLSDLETIEKARRAARQIFERDPELQTAELQPLARRFQQFWTPGAGDAS